MTAAPSTSSWRTARGEPSLTPEQLADLAALGRRVQAHFGAPQDVEFAFDEAGRCLLVQARPITTLYPLPAARRLRAKG